MSFADGVLLAAAGACAGAINAIAGGGSLVSFSALLATGYSPLTANVTNSLGVLPGYLGGALAYAPELRGQRRRFFKLAFTAAAGAVAGAALLIVTPAEAFEVAAPILVLLSCALLAIQPRLARALTDRTGEEGHPAILHAGQFAAGVYGGYFAAGFGILLLAVLGLVLAGETLQRLNALKGVLSLLIGGVAAAAYALFGPVAWEAALVMAAGSYAGGHLGVSAARRLPEPALRWGIVCLGVAVAVALFARLA